MRVIGVAQVAEPMTSKYKAYYHKNKQNNIHEVGQVLTTTLSHVNTARSLIFS
jgi:hypothetical protein